VHVGTLKEVGRKFGRLLDVHILQKMLADGHGSGLASQLVGANEPLTMNPDLPFSLPQISQISVTAHDLERATAFYRDTLGLRHLFSVPKMAFFDCGGIRLMLAIPEKPEFDHPSSILYYRVPDIHRACEILKARSVRFEREPFLVAPMPAYDLWMAFFRDSEGNLLSLMAELPKHP
jgi:catechol 2,3-dioxygenase-like lactoylglutathione lyase family enzyme